MSGSHELGPRVIAFEVPADAAALPELEAAVAGLRAIVEADGGYMYDRQPVQAGPPELDLSNDDEFRQAARAAQRMRAEDLLHPRMRVADLMMDTARPQRLVQGVGTAGLATRVLNALKNVGGKHAVETVPHLLATHQSPLLDAPYLKDKGIQLLRRSLIASGMPPEFPWPLTARGDTLLRGLSLIADTFNDLPYVTQEVVAADFGFHHGFYDSLTPEEVHACGIRYAEQREGLLQILRA